MLLQGYNWQKILPIFVPNTKFVRNLLLLEELAQFILGAIAMYIQPLHFAWWLWPIIFFAPDLSMIGYLINTQIGSITYNLVHHKFTGVALILIGYFIAQPAITLTGIVLYSHSSFDRVLGYGLKYPDNFKHTHLGWMGAEKTSA